MINGEIVITDFIILDNDINIAIAIDEQKNFNLRLCEAHIEKNALVLTPTEYSGRKQLVIEGISEKHVEYLLDDGKVIIAECLKDKEFGDIVEIKLQWKIKKL